MYHKYEIGDKVIFTNEFGVCWGVKTITALDERSGKPTYHIEPTDTPWFSTDEALLKLADEDDLAAQRDNQMNYLQSKHGRATTQEELDMLLDGDPFEGER